MVPPEGTGGETAPESRLPARVRDRGDIFGGLQPGVPAMKPPEYASLIKRYADGPALLEDGARMRRWWALLGLNQ